MADPEKKKNYLYGDDDDEEEDDEEEDGETTAPDSEDDLGPMLGSEQTSEESLPPYEEKKPLKPASGPITEAIREGFARALMEARVPPAIRDLLLSQAKNLGDKLHNLASKPFPDIASARQGAHYFMSSYVLPAAQNLGYDILLGPDLSQWAYTSKLVSDPKVWYKNLEMVLYQTKQEMAAAENLSEPADDPSAAIAARAAQKVRASIPQVWKPAPPPGVGKPDLVAEAYEHPAREGATPPGYVAPGGPQTISERIAAGRTQRENSALAMRNAGYVLSVVPGIGIEAGGQYWVRPGERGSREAEEFARQARNASFIGVAPLIQAAQTAADERQAKYAQEERIAAQVAPYMGTVPQEMPAREAFEIGRGNLGALEALRSGGRAAYDAAQLGTNIEQKFGQSRLRSEFPAPSAGYETSIMGQWGARNPVEASQKMQAAREPWSPHVRRQAEPLAAQEPELWEKYAAPRIYGWEKGPQHVAASQFTAEEPFDMPFESFVKKRRAPFQASAPKPRITYQFRSR